MAVSAYTKEQLQDVLKTLSPEQKLSIKNKRLAKHAFNDLASFGEYVFGHKPAKHHQQIIDLLMKYPKDNLLIVAPPRHAKCIGEDALIQMKDGSRKRIGTVKIGDEICSFNEYSKIPEFDRVINHWDRGRQQCFKIKTYTGREVIATENHRFFTPFGWKPMKDLKIDDSIASPRKIKAIESNPLTDDELCLLAYWLAEGHPGASYGITNTMPEIIDDLRKIAERNGLTFSIRRIEERAPRITVTCPGDHSKSPITLLRKYGLSWIKRDGDHGNGTRGLTSMYKYIPEDVFRCSNSSIALFLNRLYASDGCIQPCREVSYASKSELLCRDVQSLLMRFNIRSIVKSVKRMYMGRELIFWHTKICTAEDIRQFAIHIGILGKQDRLTWLVGEENNILTQNRSNKESLRWKEWFPLMKVGQNAYTKKYKGRTSVQVISKSAIRDKNDELLRLVNETILWEPIVSIEDAGTVQTYDIETEKNHNFIADNMYVHNTTYVGVIYPTWRIARDPGVHIIYISASDDQALKQSVDVRNTIQLSARFKEVAPDIYPDYNRFWAKGMWQVKSPRFLSDKDPTFLISGFGGSKVLGSTADELIIDDLNDEKNTATSHMRQKVQDWVSRTAMTRLSPNGRVVCIMTRWHAADLASYFKDIGFRCLELQALGCGGENICDMDHYHRSPKNAPLWPSDWPFERLMQVKAGMDIWQWEGVYQGNPTPLGGTIWKEEWWKCYKTDFDSQDQDNFPILPKDFSLKIQSWDTSQHTGNENDWSVCETWGFHRGNYFLLDVFREKLEYPDLKNAVIAQFAKHKPNMVLVEDASSGASLIQELPVNTSIPVIGIKPESDKSARSRAASWAAQAGRVYIPATADWLGIFIREHNEFPNGRWDDQVDSTAQAITWIRLNTGDDAGFSEVSDELARRSTWTPSHADALTAGMSTSEDGEWGISRWQHLEGARYTDERDSYA